MLKLRVYAHLGGAAAAYRRHLSQALTGHDVQAADLPGCGARYREAPARYLSHLAAEEAAALDGETEPVIFYGNSLGALVAFEVARRRAASGRPVAGLVVAGRNAPHRGAGRSAARADDQIVETLRSIGGTPDEVLSNENLLAVFMPVLRAGFEMLDTYAFVAEPALDCPTLVFGGTEDPLVDQAGLEAWRECVSGPVRLVRPRGGHLFPVQPGAWLDDMRGFLGRLEAV